MLQKIVESQIERKIKVLQSDRGKFIFNLFQTHFELCGIIHQK